MARRRLPYSSTCIMGTRIQDPRSRTLYSSSCVSWSGEFFLFLSQVRAEFAMVSLPPTPERQLQRRGTLLLYSSIRSTQTLQPVDIDEITESCGEGLGEVVVQSRTPPLKKREKDHGTSVLQWVKDLFPVCYT